MRLRSLGVAFSFLLGGVFAHAQDSLVGTYTGSFSTMGPTGNSRQNGVTLVVESVVDGVARGTATLNTGGPCSGNYPLQGKFADGRLVMRTTAKGGAASDCVFGLNVAVEGNRFVGTTGGGRPLTLSK